MKARFEFDCNDFDEHNTMMRMLKSDAILSVVWSLDQWLRNKVKYNMDEPDEAVTAYESAREHLHDLLSDNDIDLDRLMS